MFVALFGNETGDFVSLIIFASLTEFADKYVCD